MHRARGMVITLEIKHHQLWGFSTFHSVPLPTSPPKSLRCSLQQNGPCCHSLRPSACFFFYFFFVPQFILLLLLSSLPSHLFSFNFLYPLALSICTLFFLSLALHPFIPSPAAKFTLFPISSFPPMLIYSHTFKNKDVHSLKWPHKTNDPHHCMSGMWKLFDRNICFTFQILLKTLTYCALCNLRKQCT